MLLQHDVCGLNDRRLRCDGDNGSAHDLMGAHGGLHWLELISVHAIPAGMPRFDPSQPPKCQLFESFCLMQLNVSFGPQSYYLKVAQSWRWPCSNFMNP